MFILVFFISIIVILFLSFYFNNFPIDDSKALNITNIIKNCAKRFLRLEFTYISLVSFFVFCLIFYFSKLYIAISFMIGVVVTMLAGFLGIIISTSTNGRSACAAKNNGVVSAWNVAYSGGLAVGFVVVTLSLFVIWSVFFIFDFNSDFFIILQSSALGVSFVALFARIGGGIYTKGADIGSDMVGKLEYNLNEDDHRNPASIADNVGDIVGDVAGMSSDLMESMTGAIVSSIYIYYFVLNNSFSNDFLIFGFNFSNIPDAILISIVGFFVSVVSVILMRFFKFSCVKNKMFFMGIFPNILSLFLFFLMFFNNLNVFFSICCGIFSSVLISGLTYYFTSSDFAPTRSVVNSAFEGAANLILKGMSVSMFSTFLTVLILCLVMLISYFFYDLYGISLAAVAMLNQLVIIIAADAFGAIVDNAGGISEMSSFDESVRDTTDFLDSIGNTTAAMGKGYAVGSACLTSVSIFSSFINCISGSVNFNIVLVLSGVLIGCGMVYIFSALTIESVVKAASNIVEEVRRQFKNIQGLLETEDVLPDYDSCIDISTISALKGMILPSLLAVLPPIVLTFFKQYDILYGVILGVLTSGVVMGIFMSNAGGIWDNAKKKIETYGKNSYEHKNSIIGDTVGDPLKDTSGPSLNIFMKLLSICSLILVMMRF